LNGSPKVQANQKTAKLRKELLLFPPGEFNTPTLAIYRDNNQATPKAETCFPTSINRWEEIDGADLPAH